MSACTQRARRCSTEASKEIVGEPQIKRYKQNNTYKKEQFIHLFYEYIKFLTIGIHDGFTMCMPKKFLDIPTFILKRNALLLIPKGNIKIFKCSN